MCPMVDMYELRDQPQKGNLKKRSPGNLQKEERVNTTEHVRRDEESIFGTRREIEAIPAKITMLHTGKESIISKAEEDPKTPGTLHISKNHFR